MSIDYKYISRPYTLDELVTGNPIFKVYYDFFYNYYEWEQDNDAIEVDNYTDKEHLELLFNEFLNIVGLLLFENVTYNETFKKLKLKTEQIEMLWFMSDCIPFLLEDHPLTYDSDISERTRVFINKIKKSEAFEQNTEIRETLYPIVEKFLDDSKNAFTYEHIYDLTYFFDVHHTNCIEQVITATKAKLKRKEDKNTTFKGLFTMETQEMLDASQKVLLIEELIRSDKWGNATERKKAEIISQIIDRNPDNIRRILAEINKPLSATSQKFKEDLLKAQKTIKILG
ncbi:hypothetical protein [Flavobacterium sp. IMCC34518]|uniref:hypothetical protein n=1 Tax=Flavobacterium sp. IMCC34518 TaxID=3003623 RepID=UPI002482F003|nr:hypothetical protein [Flavobacterium sp. IMCC34518]